MSVRSELELAESVTPDLIDDLHELEEHEFILDPDESERAAQHVRAVPPPPPPPRRVELKRSKMPPPPTSLRSRSPSGVFPIADVEQAVAAAHSAPVTAADAEISRLKAQLRARDAYVVEIERALDAWTGQLAASGIHSAEDLEHLLGRARGHAFRVAELEAEVERLGAENAELASATANVVLSSTEAVQDAGTASADSSPLRRVRGIGRRYAKQLEALGVVNVQQIAAWTNADVNRVAGQLRIAPARIKKEGWIEQARALDQRTV
jgi:predicted flap endonuclease-1-like 5' DNA nuclease